MALVWIQKGNEPPQQVNETTPGILGTLPGYKYVNAPSSQPSPSPAPVQSSPNTSGMQAGSQQWYQLQPGESIPAYNARIASGNSNLPAPGTTSSTGVTNTATPGNLITPTSPSPAAPPASTPIITAPRTGGVVPSAPSGVTSNLPSTPPPLGQTMSGIQSGLPTTPPPLGQKQPQIQSNLPSSPPVQPGVGGGLSPLPPIQSQAGSLSAFADALDASVARAKQQRNELIGGIMEPQQGTLMASDFNSIIGNLNRASANFSTELVGKAIDYATPQFQTSNVPGVGLVEYQMDSLGQVTGQRVIAPEQAQPYQATTFEQDGTMYQYYIDPKTGAAVSAPQPIFSNPQSQQYQYQTFEQDGAMYQYAVDPNTGQAVSAPTPIFQSPQQSQYQYQTFEQDGTMYQYAVDPKTGQAVSSPQPIFSGPGGAGGATKYDYQTGSNGEIFEYSYGPNGQLQNVQQIGTMPQQLQEAQKNGSELRSVSGVGLVMVKPDGSYEVVVAEKDKPSSTKMTESERKDQEISGYKQDLLATKGSDGKVNTEAYRNAMNSWSGTTKSFFETFPPAVYLNADYAENDEFFDLYDQIM